MTQAEKIVVTEHIFRKYRLCALANVQYNKCGQCTSNGSKQLIEALRLVGSRYCRDDEFLTDLEKFVKLPAFIGGQECKRAEKPKIECEKPEITENLSESVEKRVKTRSKGSK